MKKTIGIITSQKALTFVKKEITLTFKLLFIHKARYVIQFKGKDNVNYNVHIDLKSIKLRQRYKGKGSKWVVEKPNIVERMKESSLYEIGLRKEMPK